MDTDRVKIVPGILNTQRRALLAPFQNEVEYRSRHKNRREKVCNETEHKGDRKTLDWARPKGEQYGGRSHRGHVRINNGDEGVLKTAGYRRRHGFPTAQFFSDALEDQHV